MSWQPGRDGILGVLERANSRGWSSTPDWRCGTATHPIATPCLVSIMPAWAFRSTSRTSPMPGRWRRGRSGGTGRMGRAVHLGSRSARQAPAPRPALRGSVDAADCCGDGDVPPQDGTLVTPVGRRRPEQLARQVATWTSQRWEGDLQCGARRADRGRVGHFGTRPTRSCWPSA